MKHWRTTWAAVACAIGEILKDDVSVPYWVNLAGKCISSGGMVLLGMSAADRSVTTKETNQWKKEPETKQPV